MGAFHAYDIRGIWNVDFDRETAYKVAYFLPELHQMKYIRLFFRELQMQVPMSMTLV